MTVRALTKPDQIVILETHRELWREEARRLRNRADDQMARRHMIDLEDAAADLDDVIGNMGLEVTAERELERES